HPRRLMKLCVKSRKLRAKRWKRCAKRWKLRVKSRKLRVKRWKRCAKSRKRCVKSRKRCTRRVKSSSRKVQKIRRSAQKMKFFSAVSAKRPGKRSGMREFRKLLFRALPNGGPCGFSAEETAGPQVPA
ncbi:MAG: hypothetical protein J6A23_12225, partial [Thermoguttaceae bacterium]|nr:hypothetical protein [Thermoguttaceae bacterium]